MLEPEPAPSNTPAAMMLVDEALRLLERQESTLDSLRTQAIAIVSVGAVAAGLFASRIPKHRSGVATGAVFVALAAFVLSALLVAWIVAPRRWDFAHDLSGPLGRVEDAQSVRAYDVAFTWARGYEAQRKSNEAKLQKRMWGFAMACGFLSAQVVAWVVASA